MNVLIADDQKHIRDGLQAMLQQFSMEINHIFSAANGYEALQILHQNEVQLVITDIKMPDMDGLELMAHVKQERIETDFIIISGYSDFVYAQKAIGLGAKSYLLKPVKRDDLYAAAANILQEWTTRQTLALNMEHLSRRVEETDRKELRMFMQGATNDDAWIDLTEAQLPALWKHYRLCLVREDLWINQPGANSSHRIESLSYHLYGNQGCLCIQRQPHLIMAIDANAELDLLSHALTAEQIRATAIMTNPQQGLKKLPNSYKDVIELYQHSYLFPDKQNILPEHIEKLEQHWELPYEDLYRLFHLIGTKKSGQIADGISMLFHKTVLQRYHIRYTQQLSRATVQMLEQYERVIHPYMGEEALDLACLQNIFDYPGIRNYIQALQQQLLRLDQYYFEFKCSYRNTQDLNEAIRFIHDNYSKPLDLAMVSNHVSLNYAYFSNLFKKNIGKGFAEYLRDVRLDKARRLLAETDQKIVDIAVSVGYESYKSFTRAFRDAIHMQPTEYRQLMRRKLEQDDGRHTAL